MCLKIRISPGGGVEDHLLSLPDSQPFPDLRDVFLTVVEECIVSGVAAFDELVILRMPQTKSRGNLFTIIGGGREEMSYFLSFVPVTFVHTLSGLSRIAVCLDITAQPFQRCAVPGFDIDLMFPRNQKVGNTHIIYPEPGGGRIAEIIPAPLFYQYRTGIFCQFPVFFRICKCPYKGIVTKGLILRHLIIYCFYAVSAAFSVIGFKKDHFVLGDIKDPAQFVFDPVF